MKKMAGCSMHRLAIGARLGALCARRPRPKATQVMGVWPRLRPPIPGTRSKRGEERPRLNRLFSMPCSLAKKPPGNLCFPLT